MDELESLTLLDEIGDEFNIVLNKNDYDKVMNGDYVLAHKYLSEAKEKKDRLVAFKVWTADNSENKENTNSIIKEHHNIQCLEDSTNTDTNSASNQRWSIDETKQLIDMYKTNIDKFNNPKYKVKTIWTEFSRVLNYTSEQIETKFKNLKRTYHQVKDNNKKTGRGKVDWMYFESMDEIYGSKPENEPLSIASSTVGFTSNENVSETDTEDEMKKAKKRKAATTEPEWAKLFREDCNRRHTERMQLGQQFLDVLKNIIEK